MLGAKKFTRQRATEYATRADFCRIFSTDMKSLYLLSFLLTGDHSSAERCFVGGLEDSTKSNAVFSEWARSWAHRKIIENAIRMVRPTPNHNNSSSDAGYGRTVRAVTERPEISAVIALAAFERFVFVMSVLEGYSVNNCSLLLACTGAEVNVARTRALQDIGISAELQRESIELSERPNQLKADSDSRHQLKAIVALDVAA